MYTQLLKLVLWLELVGCVAGKVDAERASRPYKVVTT